MLKRRDGKGFRQSLPKVGPTLRLSRTKRSSFKSLCRDGGKGTQSRIVASKKGEAALGGKDT